MKRPARRVALCGILTATALILSYVESLIPFPMPVPGMKLGLANIVTLYALLRLGVGDAAAIVLARCVLSAFLFGSPSMLAFSLAGGFTALFTMAALAKIPALSEYGVSVGGAGAHHIGQVAVAALTTSPALLSYLQVLLPVSIVTGYATALVYRLLLPHIRTLP